MMEEKVFFQNLKGYGLAGILKRPKKKSETVVIFSHGLYSGKDSRRNKAIAEALIEKGISAFLIDFTGHGESEGQIIEATVQQMADDLGSALHYIESRKEFKKIGLSGSSLGGTVAILRASTDKRIDTMVLRNSPSEGYYEYARNIKFPVMILQGGADRTILQESKKLLDALGGDKKLEIIEGATHLFEGHEKEMVEKTVTWFVKYLIE
jgi:alpha-beta hydrolase superfamily lysophospholipase